MPLFPRSLAVLGAGALAFTPTQTRAVVPTSTTIGPAALGPSQPATRSQRQEFTTLHEAAEQAGTVGEWDRFLDAAERALVVLPEDATTHGMRADVMDEVGDWHVEARSTDQLRRSVAILEAYVSQLREAYGNVAERRPGWAPAQEYLEALRGKLPPETESGPGPALPPSVAPPTADERSGRPTPPRAPTAMIATGGALTGVGTAILIAGLVFVGRWAGAAKRYGDRKDYFAMVCPPSPDPCAEEDEAWDDYRGQIPPSLGLAIPGALLLGAGIGLLVVGVRARKKRGERAPTPVSLTGLSFRF